MYKLVALLFPLLAICAQAADVAGRWTGTVDVNNPDGGDRIQRTLFAVFEQKGDAVTVKVGRRGDEVDASGEGKIEGDVLAFSVKAPEGAEPFRFRLVLVAAGRLEGDIEGKVDTGKIAGKVKLEKQPAR